MGVQRTAQFLILSKGLTPAGAVCNIGKYGSRISPRQGHLEPALLLFRLCY
jgi:hypothetical protein